MDVSSQLVFEHSGWEFEVTRRDAWGRVYGVRKRRVMPPACAPASWLSGLVVVGWPDQKSVACPLCRAFYRTSESNVDIRRCVAFLDLEYGIDSVSRRAGLSEVANRLVEYFLRSQPHKDIPCNTET